MHLFRFIFSFFIISFAFGKGSALEFEGIPLITKEIRSASFIELQIFDPGDSVLWPEKLPFMLLTFDKDKVGYLDTLTKTDSLSGSQSTKLAKELAIHYGMDTLELSDAAITLQCKGEGTFCHDEPLIPLRQLGIFKTGKGFYEAQGAISEDPILYRAAADFLYLSLVAQDLILDLIFLEKEIPEAHLLSAVIEKALTKTEVKTAIPLSELYRKVAELSLKDQECHELWHHFVNQIILSENTIFLEAARKAYKNRKTSDPRLLRAISIHILAYVKISKIFCEKHSLEEERFIPLFISENFLQEWLFTRFQPIAPPFEEDEDPPSIIWTMQNRASAASYKRTFLAVRFPLRSPLLEEVYFQALDYIKPAPPLRFPVSIELDPEEISAILKEYFPGQPFAEIGHLYLLFELAKAIVEDSSDFVFILK